MLILTVGWFFDANAVGRHYYYFLRVRARFHRCPTDPGRCDGFIYFRCRSLVTIDHGRRPGFDHHSRCPVAHCCCCCRRICCLSNFALSMIDKSAVFVHSEPIRVVC